MEDYETLRVNGEPTKIFKVIKPVSTASAAKSFRTFYKDSTTKAMNSDIKHSSQTGFNPKTRHLKRVVSKKSVDACIMTEEENYLDAEEVGAVENVHFLASTINSRTELLLKSSKDDLH